MIHYFFSLSTSTEIGACFFGSIVLFAFCISVADAIDTLILKLRLLNYSLHNDEFEGRDDPYAVVVSNTERLSVL